jgi:hypothetical protein
VGRNWYQSTGIALVLGRCAFFFNSKGPLLGFCVKNASPLLKQKLFVMRERISEALKIVYSA